MTDMSLFYLRKTGVSLGSLEVYEEKPRQGLLSGEGAAKGATHPLLLSAPNILAGQKVIAVCWPTVADELEEMNE